MGKRSALAIGVSDYGDGFESLPGSLLDVQEIKQALQDPDCGDYDVKAFENKESGFLTQQIEQFFRNCDQEDLLLFYFSGHGDLGAGGFSNQQLHLCATNSIKEPQGLIESSAISAAFLKRQMDNSPADNIIVILDCCYSGKIADLLKKGEDEIDFDALKAEGRVVLASSSASQVALQEEDGLSLYTKYLIEGMRGSAPFQGKWIAAQQLHHYADRRFEVERRGGYRPKIISDDTGFNLPIVRAPKPDPKLEYRQVLDELFQELDDELHFEFNGQIDDPLDRGMLETSRVRWQLEESDALAIETQVQKPYLIRCQKRQQYAEFVRTAAERPSARATRRLKQICNNLGLAEEDALRIETTLGFSRVASDAVSPKPKLKQEEPSQAPVTEVDQRYAKLNEYLEQQEWKKADQETYLLMITKVGRTDGDYFREADLLDYPCDDLLEIDRLWVHHSQGKFGFSVQKKIWQECGSPTQYNEQWEQFGDRVGWRTNGEWLDDSFLNPSLREGNFPKFPTRATTRSLFSRPDL